MNNSITTPVCTFTVWEKLWAQLSYNSAVVVGSWGLFLTNKALGICYGLFAYTSILILVRYTVCPRCPHLHLANDCVNLPAPVMKKIISTKRKGPLNVYEKLLFVTALYGAFMFPLYWLASFPKLLAAFLLLYGGHLISLHLHYCRRCANKHCIQHKGT